MSKKIATIVLIILAVVGSLFTALGSNMFFSDIANIEAGLSGILATLPALLFAALFPTAFLFVTRVYLRPKNIRSLLRLYSIIALVLAFLSFVMCLVSGFAYYGTFVAPYPFPGYLIIFMVLDVLVLALGGFGLFKSFRLPKEEEKFKVRVGHVFRTLGWFLFICLVLNRLGMFLASPIYIQWRTFYMTFPFYLFLLVPVLVGTLKMLVLLEFINNKKVIVIASASVLAVTVILFTTVALIGVNETAFISGVSPAMPLERLASKPVELPIHLAGSLAVGIILLVQALKKKPQVAD